MSVTPARGRQLSLFGVEARPPTPLDLEGLLAGAGQVGRMGGTGKVSIEVEEGWRAAVLRAECELRGLVTTCEPTGVEDRWTVRTAYSAALAPLAARWLDGTEKRSPSGLALDGRRLRLWVIAAGRYDGPRAFLLRLAPSRPRPPAAEHIDQRHTNEGDDIDHSDSDDQPGGGGRARAGRPFAGSGGGPAGDEVATAYGAEGAGEAVHDGGAGDGAKAAHGDGPGVGATSVDGVGGDGDDPGGGAAAVGGDRGDGAGPRDGVAAVDGDGADRGGPDRGVTAVDGDRTGGGVTAIDDDGSDSGVKVVAAGRRRGRRDNRPIIDVGQYKAAVDQLAVQEQPADETADEQVGQQAGEQADEQPIDDVGEPVDDEPVISAKGGRGRKRTGGKISAFDPGPVDLGYEVEDWEVGVDAGPDDWPDSGVGGLPTVVLDPVAENAQDADAPENDDAEPEPVIDRRTADNWLAVGDALAAAGLPAVFVAPDAGGPAYRIVGQRRIARLAELVGEPPARVPAEAWPR